MALNRFDPFVFHGFNDFLSPFGLLTAHDPRPRPHELLSLFDDRLFRPDMSLIRTSPGFEIREDDNKFEISMDLPGVKAEDLNVELLGDGRVLHIHGGRKIEKDNEFSEAKFEKTFTIGENVDTTQFKANLKDGVLVVEAPKRELPEPVKTKIPVTENPHPRLEPSEESVKSELRRA